jgi:hypothetical protein
LYLSELSSLYLSEPSSLYLSEPLLNHGTILDLHWDLDCHAAG